MVFGLSAPEMVYGFATGRVRALESRLMEAPRISRLIDASNLEEMQMILAETIHSPAVAAANSVDGIEEALEGRLGEAYELAEEFDLPWQLGRFWRTRHDFNNLRALLKSGFGQELDVRLSSLGHVPPEEAETVARTRSFSAFPDVLRAAVYSAIAAHDRSGELEAIDVELDRHYFKYRHELAGALYSEWINRYVQLQVDLANGRIAIRARVKGIAPAALTRLLVDGGTIAASAWRDWFIGGQDAPVGMANEVEEAFLGDLDLVQYDPLAEAAVRASLRQTRVISAGPERVFAYIARVENEVRLVRTIMVARISGVEPQVLHRRFQVAP